MFSMILGAVLGIIGAVWFFIISIRSSEMAINALDKIHLSVDSLAAIVAFLGGLVLIALGTTTRFNAISSKNNSEKDKSINALIEKITNLESELKRLKPNSNKENK